MREICRDMQASRLALYARIEYRMGVEYMGRYGRSGKAGQERKG